MRGRWAGVRVTFHTGVFGFILTLLSSALAQTVPSFTKITSSALTTNVTFAVAAFWGDYDADGYPDLLVLNQNQPNLLFHNNGDGTFNQWTSGHLAMTSGNHLGAAWGDYDGDGFLDLFVAVLDGPGRLYHNDGGTNFTLVTNSAVGAIVTDSANAIAAGWADFNRDGNLDLFVIRASGGDMLYKNNGNGTFSSVPSSVSGISAGNGVAVFCLWGDYNNDGYPDLLIGGGTGANVLYRNNGGGFTAVTPNPFPLLGGRSAFGAAWCDYDGDGYLDLLIGHDGGGKTLNLYHNNRDGTFTQAQAGDLGADSVLGDTSVAWQDADNDGNPDAFVINVQFTNLYFRNNGDGTFSSLEGLPINEDNQSQAAAWTDYDRDGWADLFVAHSVGGCSLFHNNGGKNAWLSVRCCNRFPNSAAAIGATVGVTARIAGVVRTQVRQIFGGDGYHSPQDLVASFGLGDATNADLVHIAWPSGSSSDFTNVPINTHVVVSPETSIVSPGASIYRQPSGQDVPPGADVTLRVWAAGVPPLTYQWMRNGVPIAGATGASLLLTNAQYFQGGRYSVAVSNAFNTTLSSEAVLIVRDTADLDSDGIPNWWEVLYGLDPNVPADASALPVVGNETNRLTYLQAYLHGLNPTNIDNDADGVTDYDEIFLYASDPRSPSTPHDGIPDGWKARYGFSPLLNLANNQIGSSGVTYGEIYRYDLMHTNEVDQLDPRSPFSAPGTSIYEVLHNGQHTNSFYYDREDRLIGAEYSRGISIAYTYDGNGNILRQTVLSRAKETNGLPILWQFLNGLTNDTPANGPYGDPDGDGWSNYQEWVAGSSPTNPNSRPDALNNPGTNIASLVLPFVPSNFVVGVGQLDASPSDQIVIGADGNPGANTNFLLVLAQSGTTWSTQRVDVGTFGITSIAVGQVANRPAPAIYLGLRRPSGGGILELLHLGASWQSNLVASSTNESAFVLGVQSRGDLLATFAPRNGPDGALYGLSLISNVWAFQTLDINTSHRGLGTTIALGTNQTSLRLLDSGAIQVGYSVPLPTNAVYRASANKWYFATLTAMTWSNSLAFAQQYGATLVSVADASENSFVRGLVPNPSDVWIGLYRNRGSASWIWTDGTPSLYQNWRSGEPNDTAGPNHELWVWQEPDATWNDAGNENAAFAVAEMIPLALPAIQAPSVASTLLSRGRSLSSGALRPTNAFSIFYSLIDDKNLSGSLDADDDFVIAEYSVNGTNASTFPLLRQPISSAAVAQSYGMAAVNFLNRSNEVLFTAQPDGQVFAWTATDTTNALRRQLFSANYSGSAWHALAGAKTLDPGEGLLGLRVDPAHPNTCDVIFWAPQPELPRTPEIRQTAPITQILPDPNSGKGVARVKVRIWDGEGNASLPFLQYQDPANSNWVDAALVRIDGLPFTLSSRFPALPTGSEHELLWNATTNLGIGFAGTVLLHVRSRDVTLTGDWSPAVSYFVQTTLDSDGDGFPDSWELIAGTDPLNPNSLLKLTSIEQQPSGVRVNWTGGLQSRQILEKLLQPAPTNALWAPLYTNPAAVNGTYLDFIAPTGAWYRIRLDR